MMKTTLFLLLTFCLFITAEATHLRGGQITIKRLSAGARTVRVTVTVFTNIPPHTNVLFGGDDDILDFGDGSDPDGDGRPGILVPEQQNIIRSDLGNGVGMASYTIDWTYGAGNFFIVSYSEPNRNEGIMNMSESVNTRFYIETGFSLDFSYASPAPLADAVFRTPAGNIFSAGLGCRDPQGLKLTYELIEPQQEKGVPVKGYTLPENVSFNQYTGEFEWDGNFLNSVATGELSFAVKVMQHDPDGAIVGYVIRDFQVIADASDLSISVSDNSDLNVNNKIYAGENSSKEISVVTHAPGADLIEMQASSELLQGVDYSFTTSDSTSNDGEFYKVGKLNLNTTTSIVRTNPYNIIVRSSVKKGSDIFVKDLTYLYYTTVTDEAEDDGRQVFVITGNESTVANAVRVYPNPAVAYIHFHTPGEKFTSFSIVDLSGKPIVQEIIPADGLYDVGQIPRGVYLLTLFSAGKSTYTSRLLLK
jgi:hypothetical protein